MKIIAALYLGLSAFIILPAMAVGFLYQETIVAFWNAMIYGRNVSLRTTKAARAHLKIKVKP